MRLALLLVLLLFRGGALAAEDFGGVIANPYDPVTQRQLYEEHHAINNPYSIGDSNPAMDRQRSDQWRIYFRIRKYQLDVERMKTDQTEVKAALDEIKARLDVMSFLLHAAAFTIGALLGFASWGLALQAMRESDF